MKLSAQGAETKRKIMGAAAEVFGRQGVRATRPMQIIQASGVTKGEFYHYFKNKEGLVQEVLHASAMAIETNTAPISYECHSWADLERCVLAHIEFQKHFNMTRSCPIGTVANEITENDELVRRQLSLIFENMKRKLTAFLSKEQADGRLVQEADVDGIADFCLSIIQGAMLLGRVKKDVDPVEGSFHEAMVHLRRYTVLPKAEPQYSALAARP